MACLQKNLHLCLFFFAMILGRGMATDRACTTGGVCCQECSSRCPEQSIACFSNCRTPCFDGNQCIDVGDRVATGVAIAACAETLTACGMPVAFATTESFVDLTGCCNIVINSCAGAAANIACTVPNGDYGTCTEQEFNFTYQNAVADTCRTAVCRDRKCAEALAGNRQCN